MRNIVCMGYAKCGTTLLDQAVRMVEDLVAPVEGKEIKFFLPRNFPELEVVTKYLEKFDLKSKNATSTFEASPQYLHQKGGVFLDVLKNVRRVAADPVIVICVRHPVLRAYSHYIHNLQEFALYGNEVFNKRPDLIRKGCALSFEDALVEGGRIKTNYSQGISAAISAFGKDRVRIFFLESDAKVLGDWMRSNLQVSSSFVEKLNEVGGGAPVFSRRPLPNYYVDGNDLIAYGADREQLVRYSGVSTWQIDKVIQDQEKWTTVIDPVTVGEVLGQHFVDDLQECERITGDRRFLQYLNESTHKASAELASEHHLRKVHGFCV